MSFSISYYRVSIWINSSNYMMQHSDNLKFPHIFPRININIVNLFILHTECFRNFKVDKKSLITFVFFAIVRFHCRVRSSKKIIIWNYFFYRLDVILHVSSFYFFTYSLYPTSWGWKIVRGTLEWVIITDIFNMFQ